MIEPRLKIVVRVMTLGLSIDHAHDLDGKVVVMVVAMVARTTVTVAMV